LKFWVDEITRVGVIFADTNQEYIIKSTFFSPQGIAQIQQDLSLKSLATIRNFRSLWQ